MKKKSKKKNERDSVTQTKIKKTEARKLGMIIIFALLLMIAFMSCYVWLLEILTLKFFSPDYFVCSRLPANVYTIMIPFIFVFIFVILFYIAPSRKLANKKYIGIASALLIITLLLTAVFSSNVWAFDKNAISYSTLFQRDKIVYDFNDIESLEAHYELIATRLGSTKLVYTLNMSDGKSVEVDVYNSFMNDDNNLIEFDKAIADKRTLTGDFEPSGAVSDEINEYYKQIFETDK